MIRKTVQFTVHHPWLISSFVFLLTVLSFMGMGRLQMDPSIESLMPEKDKEYTILKKARQVYGNQKSLMILAVEAMPGRSLKEPDIFKSVADLSAEIRAFHKYDPEHRSRILKLASAAGITVTEIPRSPANAGKEAIKTGSDDTALDDAFLEDKPENSVKVPDFTKDNDLWNIGDEREVSQNFIQPEGPALSFQFGNYVPVSAKEILAVLEGDTVGTNEALTALHAQQISAEDRPLSEKEFSGFLNYMNTLSEQHNMKIVRHIMDPVSGEDVKADKESLILEPFLKKDSSGKLMYPVTEEDFRNYENSLRINPMNKDFVYAEDENGRITAFGIFLLLQNRKNYQELTIHLHNLKSKYAERGLQVTIAGDPVLDYEINKINEKDMGIFLPFVLFFLILVFWLNFRSKSVTVMLTVTVILGTVWTMGIMGWLGIPLTITGSILPPILIAVGSSYGIHIANQYFQTLREHQESDQELTAEGLTESLLRIAPTVGLAGFTTVAGFLMLALTEVETVRQFGILAALGTAVSVIISVFLIPALFALVRPNPSHKSVFTDIYNNRISAFINIMKHAAMNHPAAVIGIYAVILAVSAAGITRMTTDSSPITFFHESSGVRQNFHKVDQLFKGTYSVEIEFDSGTPGGVHNPEFLKKIERIRSRIEALPDRNDLMILKTVSYTDFPKRMHMAFHENNREYYVIPDSATVIKDYHTVFGGEDSDGDGRQDILESSADPLFRRAVLSLRIGETDERSVSTEMSAVIENRIRPVIDEELNGTPWTYRIFGLLKTYNALKNYVVSGNVKGMIMALGVIALTVWFVLRSFPLAVVSLLPMGSAVAVLYGIMGFTGIPLDTTKALLSSVAIGIGVDDTIHFLKTYSRFLKTGMNTEESLSATFDETGRAILYTSAALIFGFGVLFFSGFAPIYHLSFLITGVMAATTAGALLLLPSVLRIMYRRSV